MNPKKFDNEKMKQLLAEVKELGKDVPSIKMVSAVEKSIMQNVRGGMAPESLSDQEIYLCTYSVYQKSYCVMV